MDEMIPSIHVPRGLLAEHVELIWIVEAGGCVPRKELLIPRASIGVVIDVHGGPVEFYDVSTDERASSIDGGVILGLQLRPTVIRPEPNEYVMGVEFRPGGARSVLQVDADDLAHQHVPLCDVFGPDGDFLRERLFHAESNRERFAIMESYLSDRLLSEPAALPPPIAFALRAFRSPEGRESVANVATDVGWTGRHFSDQFAKWVGLTPRRYCRLRRLQQALELRQQTDLAWASIALAAGYADQAHLGNEFRELVGLSPRQYAGLAAHNPHHVIMAP